LLLITIDTLRADHLSAYGYPRTTSPQIDRLASEGVLFERAHSVASWTLPSIASILTSLYPSAHGCQGDRSALASEYATLAEHLAAAGFRTGAVTSHVYLAAKYGLGQGFEHYDDSLVEKTRSKSHATISSPAITEKALAWLDERSRDEKDERWFLWLHYFDPHSQYLPHPETIEPFGPSMVDHYDGEIAFTDLYLGRVLDHLRELGLANDTLVVLLADHGEEFKDHGGGGHRATLYEEVLRVPLIVRAPGIAPRRVAEPVGNIDVLPTICELLDLAPPAHIQGASLGALMRGAPDEPRVRLAEMRNNNKKDWDGLVDAQYKLLYDVTADRKLLFDLAADPAEQTDVAASHPEIVDAMWTRMQALIAQSRARAPQAAQGNAVELTPEDEAALDQLGYGGEH
jgi:arylsulfatase A-like enzyme